VIVGNVQFRLDPRSAAVISGASGFSRASDRR